MILYIGLSFRLAFNQNISSKGSTETSISIIKITIIQKYYILHDLLMPIIYQHMKYKTCDSKWNTLVVLIFPSLNESFWQYSSKPSFINHKSFVNPVHWHNYDFFVIPHLFSTFHITTSNEITWAKFCREEESTILSTIWLGTFPLLQ